MNTNNAHPLVSIIIPVYNREGMILEAIESVARQDYPHWQLIVVDDGSQDRTIERVKAISEADPRVVLIRRDRNPKGASTCRNIGLSHAAGEYVIFLDSDDVLLPSCLSRRIAYATQHQSCVAWVFPMLVQHAATEPPQCKAIPCCESYLVEFLSYRIHWGVMCTLWRRTAVSRLGGFTEHYPRFNDPDITIRALLRYGNAIQVATDCKPDSVYRASRPDHRVFYLKVADSLMLFIPDVITWLTNAGLGDQRVYLVGYYTAWWRDTYAHASINRPQIGLRIIRLFCKHGIISSCRGVRDAVLLILVSVAGTIRSRLLRLLG